MFLGGLGYIITTFVTILFWPFMVFFVPILSVANLLFPEMNFTDQPYLSDDWTKWLGEAFEDPKRVDKSILNVMQVMAAFI